MLAAIIIVVVITNIIVVIIIALVTTIASFAQSQMISVAMDPHEDEGDYHGGDDGLNMIGAQPIALLLLGFGCPYSSLNWYG